MAFANVVRPAIANDTEELQFDHVRLDKCVKEESGRSPLDHIHETTVNTIRQQLRYSNKTPKEICIELDFSSLSFFGKFVKEHLGMSPTDYRQQNLKEG